MRHGQLPNLLRRRSTVASERAVELFHANNSVESGTDVSYERTIKLLFRGRMWQSEIRKLRFG